mgnify:CR=1 FL=1
MEAVFLIFFLLSFGGRIADNQQEETIKPEKSFCEFVEMKGDYSLKATSTEISNPLPVKCSYEIIK